MEEVREKEKSLVMRCASTLRLADSMGIEPDGIAAFVDDNATTWIEKCTQLLRLRVPNAIRSRRYVRMLESAIGPLYGS